METTTRVVPDSLLPDKNHQFLQHIPQEYIEEWLSYDSWTLKMACLLITIGYPADLNAKIEEAKDWPPDAYGRDHLSSCLTVYGRAASIARSSIAAGLLQDPDTPARWLDWAKRKGYSVAHLELIKTAPAPDGERGTRPTPEEHVQELASLFDPVHYETLEKMFPTGKENGWRSFADKASANGLIAARQGRGMFNPMLAGLWWLDKKHPIGWHLERVNRVLAKNLPPRSRGNERLLTGDYD